MLEHWNIGSYYLNVIDHEGAVHGSKRSSTNDDVPSPKLYISNNTIIWSGRSNIQLREWTSNNTWVATSTGSITGIYELYDYMKLSTESGQFDVWIDPPRETSNAFGSIVEPEQFERYFHTLNEYGHTNVRVKPPRSKHKSTSALLLPTTNTPTNASSLRSLYSSHFSGSGPISINYPLERSGDIFGLTNDGNVINIGGSGVNITSDDSSSGLRMVTADKGDGDSFLMFGSNVETASLFFRDG